jgi:UDP-N-acetylglucosamine acyltransferase
MSIAQSAQVHPSAVISPQADIAENVQIGAYVVIEGDVRVGPSCILRPGAQLVGPLTMGSHNIVFSGAVLGEQPQHLRYADELTRLEIGDHNVIREHVTVHRGTSHSWATCIGSHNFLMAHSHIAHDCRVGNHCILANGALLAGHCVLEDNVYLSGNCAVHQFVRIGRLALVSGVSATSKDVPPFVILQHHNGIGGVNVVGMRRAGISHAGIDAVRRAFHIIYRSGLTLPQALAQLDGELGKVAEVAEMISFIRASTRGISLELNRDAA